MLRDVISTSIESCGKPEPVEWVDMNMVEIRKARGDDQAKFRPYIPTMYLRYCTSLCTLRAPPPSSPINDGSGELQSGRGGRYLA